MFKWAKERIRLLAGHPAERANALVAASINAPSLIITGEASRVTTRIVAISTVEIDALAGRKKLNPTRPGVHARWKEQNRVAIQHML